MNSSESNQKVRAKLAELTNTQPEDWFLCLKARFGMALVFKSIEETYGTSKIITTPYTCITAINPILSAGLIPSYEDIDTEYLSIKKLEDEAVKPKTHALVMQHTLGMIGNKSNLRKYADKHHLILIEDSAHCITRFAKDKNDQILADISIHSFGVEKILTTTKFGGAVYINPKFREQNPELYEKITNKFNKLPEPSRKMALRMRTYRVNNAVIQRLHGKFKQGLKNLEIKAGIFEPAIYPFEQDGRQAKAQTTNKYINERILSQLETLKPNYIRRSANVDLYLSRLKSPNFKIINKQHEPLLAFPIVFDNIKKAQQAYDMLTTQGYFIRRWYFPLIYPGPNSTKIYRYNPKNCPIAEDVSKRILCLPTDLPIIETKKIVDLLTAPKPPVEKAVEK